MIRRRTRKGQETGDLFQGMLPDPDRDQKPEEEEDQTKQRRETEYHADVQFRNLDLPVVPEPAADQTILDFRKWAAENLPQFEHFVQRIRVRGKDRIRWSIATIEAPRERIILLLAVRQGKTFPDGFRLTACVDRTTNRDIQELTRLLGRSSISLHTVRERIERIFSDAN